MANNWYVLHSKPNMEHMLYNQLLLRKLEAFFPRLRVNPVNPRSRSLVPYFPGYLFANLDLDQTPLSSIAWLPGMQRLVSFDNEPACVPDHLINAIEKQLELANQSAQDPFLGLHPGDRVRIEKGPFAGYDAIFDLRLSGSERARVLIQFLHDRQVRLEVPVTQLTRLSPLTRSSQRR